MSATITGVHDQICRSDEMIACPRSGCVDITRWVLPCHGYKQPYSCQICCCPRQLCRVPATVSQAGDSVPKEPYVNHIEPLINETLPKASANKYISRYIHFTGSAFLHDCCAHNRLLSITCRSTTASYPLYATPRTFHADRASS